MAEIYPGDRTIRELLTRDMTFGDIGYIVNLTVANGMKFGGVMYAITNIFNLNAEGVVEGSLLYGAGRLLEMGHEGLYHLKNKE